MMWSRRSESSLLLRRRSLFQEGSQPQNLCLCLFVVAQSFSGNRVINSHPKPESTEGLASVPLKGGPGRGMQRLKLALNEAWEGAGPSGTQVFVTRPEAGGSPCAFPS